MMLIFVSQCHKNSLKITRRILDSYANRIGERTWQTVMTQEGLIAVKSRLAQKLLVKVPPLPVIEYTDEGGRDNAAKRIVVEMPADNQTEQCCKE